ncbi:MAG: flavin reductase family protein, partial [Candidatus Zixiibacteriota bacterium]
SITGSPILSGIVGYLDCSIVKAVPTGNHTLFVGEVVAASCDSNRPILTSTNSKLRYTG